MAFPIFKVVMIILKTTSKPFANVLKKVLKNQRMMQGMFIWAGIKANEIEAKINFRMQNPDVKITKDNLVVPDITPEEAFIKGVECSVELLILYGLIGAVSLLEIKKAIKSSKRLEQKFATLE